MMANGNKKPSLENTDVDSSTSTSTDLAEFGNELNKNLTNAVFKLDPNALEAEDKETPLIDLYQISEKWIKIKFKKSGKTWTIEKDRFATSASESLTKKVDDQKIVESIEEKVTEINQDGEVKIPVKVELQWWASSDNEMNDDKAKSFCKDLWTRLVDGSWSTSIEDRITDQNISRDTYHSFVRPFKQDGTQCKDGEFVVVSKPFRSCWYTNGEYVPGSSVQIWHRAVDPIAWFGKQASEKPKTLNSYDSPDVELESPSKKLEEATLAEDEAFGYAK